MGRGMTESYSMTKVLAVAAAIVAATGLLVGTVAAQPAADRTITETSMGVAVVGSTQPELEDQLGPDYTLTPGSSFVDTEGVEVTLAGVSQFFAFHVAGDGPVLNFLVTENPEYQLASGVGPGTTIEDAAAIYGTATVTFNTESESREFVTFDAFAETRIMFQTIGPDGIEMAGTYAESTESFNESTDIKAGSIIERVWARCVGDECPTPTLPETGAAEAALPLVVVSAAMIIGGVMVALTSRRPAATGRDAETSE